MDAKGSWRFSSGVKGHVYTMTRRALLELPPLTDEQIAKTQIGGARLSTRQSPGMTDAIMRAAEARAAGGPAFIV